MCGEMSYQGLMRASFGRAGFYILTALQFIYPFIGEYYLPNDLFIFSSPLTILFCFVFFFFAAMVSYNVVVGDTVTKVLIRVTGLDPTNPLMSRQCVTFLATTLVVIPLCLYRNVAKLAKISFLSLVCVAFILLAIFFRVDSMSSIV